MSSFERIEADIELIQRKIEVIERDNPNWTTDAAVMRLITALTNQVTELEKKIPPQALKSTSILPELRQALGEYFEGRKRYRTSSTTPDEGSWIRQTLVVAGQYEKLTDGEGETVFTDAQVKLFSECATERHVVGLVMQFLEEINIPDPNCHLQLFNSELYSLIPSLSKISKYDAKPDLFIIDPRLALHRTPYLNAPNPTGKYGQLPNSAVCSSINSIWKVKKQKDENVDFQEICDYLKCCTEGIKNEEGSAIWMKGVLFDREGFQLIKCYDGYIKNSISSPWTALGSRNLLREFLYSSFDPWTSALEIWTQQYQLQFNYQNSAALKAFITGLKSTAFLGRGASGRVFAVTRPDGQKCALKIVLSSKNKDLDGEFQTMSIASSSEASADFVIKPVADSFRTFQVDARYERDLNQYETVQLNGWAYLLSEIGKPVEDDTLFSKSDLFGIITALISLHNSGRVHGDARIQNFVKVNDRWKIIDLRGAVDVSLTRRKNDFIALYQSLFPLYHGLPIQHQNEIRELVEGNSTPRTIADTFYRWLRTI